MTTHNTGWTEPDFWTAAAEESPLARTVLDALAESHGVFLPDEEQPSRPSPERVTCPVCGATYVDAGEHRPLVATYCTVCLGMASRAIAAADAIDAMLSRLTVEVVNAETGCLPFTPERLEVVYRFLTSMTFMLARTTARYQRLLRLREAVMVLRLGSRPGWWPVRSA